MKICIIGCGKQSEKYAGALTRMGVSDVRAVDTVSSARTTFSEMTGCRTYENLEAAIGAERFDGALICTPLSSHVPLALSLIEQRITFMCEKPLAATSAQVNKLTELAKAAGVAGGVTFTYRYAPAFERLKEMLTNDPVPLGELRTAVFRIGGRGNHRFWKHRKPDGGVTQEMFSHMLDLALWLFGEFDELVVRHQDRIFSTRQIGQLKEAVDAEDFTIVSGMTKSGIQCVFISDFFTPSFAQYVEVQGENGSYFGSIQPLFPSRVNLNSTRGGLDAGLHEIDTSGNAVDGIVKNLIDAIEHGAPFRCSLEEASLSQNHMETVLGQIK